MSLSSCTRNNHCMDLIKQYKTKRNDLKAKIRKCQISGENVEEHMKLVFALHKLPRNSSQVRYRNRCAITGRSRGVYRYFGLSRIKIRELAMKGMLPGVTAASW